MSSVTRRRLILCVAIAALTLPADLILVQAVSTNTKATAEQWAASLPDQALENAAGRIQDYPFEYRKEIMRRLPAARRARVWIDHVSRFRDERPELSTEQIDALNAAIGVIDETFNRPSDSAREATKVVAERITELFGSETADFLLHRLGARRIALFVNAAPWQQKLSNFVRERFVVAADGAGSCNCATGWGCSEGSATWCNGNDSCSDDDDWPKCGWLWDETCDGRCWTGIQT